MIGGIWGTIDANPDWPEFAGLEQGDVSVPDLFKYSGLHAPDLRLARFDHAWDQVQEQFAALAGLPGGVLAVLDANEALSEDAGVELDVFIAAGTDHAILGQPEMYTLESSGVRFVDWLTTFVDGDSPGDVRCDGDCGAPPADG